MIRITKRKDGVRMNILETKELKKSVSYTHLDVYKRQFENSFPKNTKLYRLMTTKPGEC